MKPSDIGNDLMDVDLDVTVTIRNFLGLEGNQTIKIRRENKDLPKLVLSSNSIKTQASRQIILKGNDIKRTTFYERVLKEQIFASTLILWVFPFSL